MAKRLAITTATIVALSFGLFLFRIGQPRGYIFDEISYVRTARVLVTGGTLDQNPEHPPLAKVLISFGMKLAGDNALGWRVAGAFFGSLTLGGLFLWTYLLIRDYRLALFAAALTLLNNFLFVMSRVAMLEVFFFAFVVWGVLAFTAALELRSGSTDPFRIEFTLLQRQLLVLASGIFFGMGTACKWNALVTVAAVAFVAAILFTFNLGGIREVGIPTLVTGLLAVPVLTYFLVYLYLYHRLHHVLNVRELVQLHTAMWRFHILCPGNPALNSPWYKWLFRRDPVRSLRYLMGNFVVVWTGFVALLICATRFLRHRFDAIPEALVVLFYGANLLQWAVIPQKMSYYYYYYPAAMFLAVAIAIVLRRANKPSILGLRISLLLVVASAVFFLYCYPQMMNLQAPYDCALGCWP